MIKPGNDSASSCCIFQEKVFIPSSTGNAEPRSFVLHQEVDPPVPDLVIYLQASVDALLQRLARRNSSYDRFVDRGYLERLTDAYAQFFHEYDDGPLLIVNASAIDPVNNAADYEQLFQQIERTTGGRHFFNPAAAALA